MWLLSGRPRVLIYDYTLVIGEQATKVNISAKKKISTHVIWTKSDLFGTFWNGQICFYVKKEQHSVSALELLSKHFYRHACPISVE